MGYLEANINIKLRFVEKIKIEGRVFQNIKDKARIWKSYDLNKSMYPAGRTTVLENTAEM